MFHPLFHEPKCVLPSPQPPPSTLLRVVVTGHKAEDLYAYLREVADMVPSWDHMVQALVFGPSPDNPEVPEDEASQVSGTGMM